MENGVTGRAADIIASKTHPAQATLWSEMLDMKYYWHVIHACKVLLQNIESSQLTPKLKNVAT